MRAIIVLSEGLSREPLLGRPLVEHLVDVATSAGLVPEMVGPDFAIDGAESFVLIDGRYVYGFDVAAAQALADGGLDRVTDRAGATVARRCDETGVASALLAARFGAVAVLERAHPVEDAYDVAVVAGWIQDAVIERLGRSGVRFAAPRRVLIDERVTIEPGATIGADVTLRGATVIRAGADVQQGAVLVDTEVGAGAVVKPYSVCEGARLGPGANVGPMAHLRPGAVLERSAKVGNFVEVKNAILHEGAKASHLTYLGDAEIGAHANVGAGTITCNYDGFRKQRTDIGPGAFIGSNTALVAPVRVGAGAVIGAGSVITRDVPDDALAVERSEQRNLNGLGRKLNERNRAAAEASKKG